MAFGEVSANGNDWVIAEQAKAAAFRKDVEDLNNPEKLAARLDKLFHPWLHGRRFVRQGLTPQVFRELKDFHARLVGMYDRTASADVRLRQ